MTIAPRIVVLFPGLAAHGGIQRFGRTLCKALNDFAASGCVDVVSLHDPFGWYDARFLDHPVVGCGGDRRQFVLRSLAALSRPYDVLIVGHVDLGPLALPFRALRAHAPLISLAYGIEVWSRLPRHKRLALRTADQIWSISAYTAEQLAILHQVDRTRVRVIPIPLDPASLAAVDAWRLGGARPVPTTLLTVARMNRADIDKGIDCVIEALPVVRRFIPKLTYTIIGDGDDRKRLESLAVAHGVDDITHFVGRVPDAQLHAALAGAELFVLPSRKEGFGIVFLEAMAHACPVIAGDYGGSPEVVVQGETGLLVRHGDCTGLASAIVGLLHDRERRVAMGVAGRRRVEQFFGYQRFADTVADKLEQAICLKQARNA